ncbi:hypothetical protein OG373_41110 [Streptomyces avidinii]|uniref:hypothetical protein n=1 Tax=Streptomyces avidinii TaxID=1895 RepID=UPI0038683C08|nr:hypothetical protein OG373_00065 [Streptomyces avidinii]WTB02251.1 hypothetical protein OG373_41110 [Streptomyces avidinii]
MDEPKNAGSAAAAYAAALRAAVHGFTARGGTQKEIAVGAHVAPATLSRYLSGERVAPHHFIAALDTFLAERGLPLAAGVREELTRLCGRAHEASRSPAVQLAHLKEELVRIREEKQAGEAELTALKQRAEQLAVELEQALEQARHAESGRAVLEGRVERQDKQLRDAQSYTRGLEAELTAQHDQVLLVQREVEVLRRQNQILLEEAPAGSHDRVEDAVPVVSTQVANVEADKDSSRPSMPDLSASTFKPLTPARPVSRPGLGHADTQEEFTAQLKALRARAGGDVLWSIERLAHLSRDKPWPAPGSSPRADLVRMERWFTLGIFPVDWLRLERVLRGMHATTDEIGNFANSHHRIVKASPARPADVVTAGLTLTGLTAIGLGTAAVFQNGVSGLAKTLTALGALLVSFLIWSAAANVTIPDPDQQDSPKRAWPTLLATVGGPLILLTAVIVPLATGTTNPWGHWLADLIGLL